MDSKLKHLELIQNNISRMANNSFALKGWAVTLIAALLVLSSKDSNYSYFFIAYIPIIFFWILDSYYLLQERLYRSLYNETIKLNNENIDFEMNASKYQSCTKKNKFHNCLFSKTELLFYIPLIIVSTIVLIISI